MDKRVLTSLSFADQLQLLETFLGREIPERVRELFLIGSSSIHLLPLATGREFDPSPPNASQGDAFADAEAKFNSVLGHAIGRSELARLDPEEVWPPGLLVVEDCGCAIYRAIDLDSPELRVIEFEHLEHIDHPQAVSTLSNALAYSDQVVPERVRHRFLVIARTLDDWLQS